MNEPAIPPDDASPDGIDGAHQLPIEPLLDLHAFAPRDVVSVVNDYVTAAVEHGLTVVRIVHGRGRGVQRGMVQAALDRHPLVQEFWDDADAHLGASFARLTPSR